MLTQSNPVALQGKPEVVQRIAQRLVTIWLEMDCLSVRVCAYVPLAPTVMGKSPWNIAWILFRILGVTWVRQFWALSLALFKGRYKIHLFNCFYFILYSLTVSLCFIQFWVKWHKYTFLSKIFAGAKPEGAKCSSSPVFHKKIEIWRKNDSSISFFFFHITGLTLPLRCPLWKMHLIKVL